MRTGKNIAKEYYKADKASRFEYLYDNFRVRESVLNCEKFCLTYTIEMTLLKESWSDYCERFVGKESRRSTKARIYECLENDKPIDCLPEGLGLSEVVIDAYKNFSLMQEEFSIFAKTLKTLGRADEDLLRRYITEEITLWDIADERKISYETAKGKIRDLKKELKKRTLASFVA